jgi:hypothetical protein
MNVLPLILIMLTVVSAIGLGYLIAGKEFLTFLQETDKTYSWGRVMGAATVIAAIWGFVHVISYTHAFPEAGSLLGLTSFGGFPFALSKGITAMSRPANTDKL